MGVVDTDSFRSAMGRFPGAVTIVTALAGAERRGITATAVCSVTAEPPSVLVCLNRATGTCAAVGEDGRFNVNLLSDAADALALRFAGVGGVTGEDKFTEGDWQADSRGLPVLADATVSLSCDVAEVVEAASHIIFIGHIVEMRSADGPPLLYEQRRFHRLSPLK
ncbi:flavin reductase [Gemmobacter caeni]|uniref:Flavin reductase n=1 Tax=Gemmobacter caeni TaxID=589035 RepID=A0A2T6AV69_9RHOB|nr:flavin reductase family protein [Gemmobacter caeni]PTX47636.1 flavin reductase [Gemmobacter caeni]TWI97827.1 flavin reductase [Gemmobacter caeni]